ncbi:glutamate--tRNA ligase [Tilletia horrida]|uniref:glutamate--tRNA ligase n=1 Tax=Tilletia horrida TaxID=155126 RepID=A0AAN6GL99_9BASI|nr:glutamate--tRNA ligase [Tilletia horrida]KAK0547043.1 glutamate--tRNA ligase [Tilletia horrida]KAK0562590.1 glutamate--tRNA ligase [Tilletia horrida]
MTGSSQTSAVLTLDPLAKFPPLAPLVIINHIAAQPSASDAGALPPTVDFEADAALTLTIQPGGETIKDDVNTIVKQLANMYAHAGLSGANQAQSEQVDQLLTVASALSQADFKAAGTIFDDLNSLLALRTFVVGHTLTVADIALWAAIRASLPVIGLVKKGLHVHLSRWFSYLDALPEFSGSLSAIADAKAEKAKSKKAQASFDLFLKGAKEGQVVTRFPPEPSGYLHIGHAKAVILNQYFAKLYKGKMLVRFDDTNPSKEKAEFEESIIEDIALMGIKPDSTSHTSDYFDHLYKLAIQLIQEGKAYCDDTPQETMRAERMDGIASARRDASVEDNLARFADMSTGSDEGKKWCLRAKMSVDNPNKAMRDPVIYRCNDTPHHRVGTTWKVYPTYDFACPVIDSLEGITHALRTNEYRDRNPQYQWFIDALKIRKVEIWDFGRLNFVYTLLSKRKLTWFVDNGHVPGWDDPRFPTVRGIRRRGLTIDTLHQFMIAQGPSQALINMEWDSIWSLNKRNLDPIVPRYVALDKPDLVKASIEVVDEKGATVTTPFEKDVPRHKKNDALGQKKTIFDATVYLEQEDAKTFAQGEKVTLMDWGNVEVTSLKTGANGLVTDLALKLLPGDSDFKNTKKVTWLASTPNRPLVECKIHDYDYLINKKKLEEDDKFEDCLTPQTEFITDAMADANVATDVKKGDQVQFERKGYFILDRIDEETGVRHFILIPDGSAKASASKSSAPAPAAGSAKAGAPTSADTKLAQDGASGQVYPGIEPPTNVKMYSLPVIAANVDTPASTKMYSVKPIL